MLAATAAAAWAAAGDPDSSFDVDGIARPGTGPLLGATLQPDGKLVAAGSFGGNLAVVRFAADGQLDPSFNGSGRFVGPSGTARGVAIQPDGKIVVAATSSGAMLALRLNADGSLDGTFGGDGIVRAFAGRAGQGRAVALHDGDVIVAGSAQPSGAGSEGYDRLALARFTADGSPDAGFGSNGTQVFGVVRIAFANVVAIDGNERIVVAGSHRNDLQTTEALVLRLTASGELDPSFDDDGVFARQLARGAAFSAIYDLEIDPSNRLVMASAAPGAQGADAIAVRLNPDGTPDPSFSADGIAYMPASSDKDQYNKIDLPFPGATGLVLGGNDVILGGYFDELTIKRIAIWALRADGSPDPGFGDGGRSLTALPGESAQLHAMAIAANGDLFGVGQSGGFLGPGSGLAANYSGVGPPPGPPSPPPPPPPPPETPTCFDLPATIVGTATRDLRRGTPRRDVFVGLGGADTIVGRGGNDLVCGGSGNDRIYLQGGDDKASGDGGGDLVAGSFGADVLLGRNGRDRLFGAQGPDKQFGGGGADLLLGGKGADLLRGGAGRDRLAGGVGADDTRQ